MDLSDVSASSNPVTRPTPVSLIVTPAAGVGTWSNHIRVVSSLGKTNVLTIPSQHWKYRTANQATVPPEGFQKPLCSLLRKNTPKQMPYVISIEPQPDHDEEITMTDEEESVAAEEKSMIESQVLVPGLLAESDTAHPSVKTEPSSVGNIEIPVYPSFTLKTELSSEERDTPKSPVTGTTGTLLVKNVSNILTSLVKEASSAALTQRAAESTLNHVRSANQSEQLEDGESGSVPSTSEPAANTSSKRIFVTFGKTAPASSFSRLRTIAKNTTSQNVHQPLVLENPPSRTNELKLKEKVEDCDEGKIISTGTTMAGLGISRVKTAFRRTDLRRNAVLSQEIPSPAVDLEDHLDDQTGEINQSEQVVEAVDLSQNILPDPLSDSDTSESDTEPSQSSQPTDNIPVSQNESPNAGTCSESDTRDEPSLECMCGKKCLTVHQLRVHQVLHLDRGPYICSVCDTSFDLKCDVMCHLREHPCDQQDKCTTCLIDPLRFKSWKKFHGRAYLSKFTGQDKCIGKVDKSRPLVAKSSQEGVKPDDVQSSSTSSKSSPEKSADAEKCECPCGKILPCPYQLRIHGLLHQEYPPFTCSVCAATFNLRANLIWHTTTHPCELKHNCGECPTDIFRRPYECDVANCSAAFQYIRGLERHKRLVHEGRKRKPTVLCEICAKLSRSVSSHLIHMRTHSGEKPYPCSKCGKSFAIKSSLIAHERTHTGEKIFQCPNCGKGLSTREGMRKHRLLHTGEKPYKCKICSKDFRQLSTYSVHKKMHTGDGYKCPVCGDKFEKYSQYLKHKKIHGKK